MTYRVTICAALLLALAACNSGTGVAGGSSVPGDTSSTEAFDKIAPEEELHFTGTEPFWGGQVKGRALVYTTPEEPEGHTIAVERFSGRGGIAFSGKLAAKSFDLMVTEGECSDGMSDRTYPFTATLHVGGQLRSGCAWSTEHPFEGPEAP